VPRIERRSGGGCLGRRRLFPGSVLTVGILPGNGTPSDVSVTPLRRNAIWGAGSVRGAPSMTVRSPCTSITGPATKEESLKGAPFVYPGIAMPSISLGSSAARIDFVQTAAPCILQWVFSLRYIGCRAERSAAARVAARRQVAPWTRRFPARIPSDTPHRSF
jgi:hypothetical protein